MAVRPTIRVQREDFDTAAEIRLASDVSRQTGAVVTFTGVCRDDQGALAALELEHYPGMAERALEETAAEALRRWPLLAVTILHRFGRIAPGENIVLVVTASSHRQAAFEAASFLMDFLKSRAPFWKKVIHVDGSDSGWVDAKEADEDAIKRWSASEGFDQ